MTAPTTPFRDLPAVLGGAPLAERPLHIVRPTFPPLGDFAAEFDAALRSGQVTNHGPHVRAFEKALTDYLGVPALAFSSGQAALLAMLRAAGIDGGEVIVPSFTFAATPHAVRWCGAEPVFADSDPSGSLVMDPADAEARITPRTRALLAVEVYGIAPDYAAFEALGRRHGLRVLFDSAPAFGTRAGGVPVGRFGDAQSFSFHATKAFATMEGGAVSSRDAALLERAASIRNFGQTGGGADCGTAGFNGKMQEVCALIGLRQLPSFDRAVARRREVAARYREKLAAVPGLSFARVPDGQEPVWLYFPVFVDPVRFGTDRNALAAALAAENLHVRKYFELPCHHMTAYAAQRSVALPRAERAAYSVVALPVYNDMTDAECDLFAEGIARIHRHAADVAARTAQGGAR